MYAVIQTGGKQYRVSPGETLEVEKLPGDVGVVKFKRKKQYRRTIGHRQYFTRLKVTDIVV